MGPVSQIRYKQLCQEAQAEPVKPVVDHCNFLRLDKEFGPRVPQFVGRPKPKPKISVRTSAVPSPRASPMTKVLSISEPDVEADGSFIPDMAKLSVHRTGPPRGKKRSPVSKPENADVEMEIEEVRPVMTRARTTRVVKSSGTWFVIRIGMRADQYSENLSASGKWVMDGVDVPETPRKKRSGQDETDQKKFPKVSPSAELVGTIDLHRQTFKEDHPVDPGLVPLVTGLVCRILDRDRSVANLDL